MSLNTELKDLISVQNKTIVSLIKQIEKLENEKYTAEKEVKFCLETNERLIKQIEELEEECINPLKSFLSSTNLVVFGKDDKGKELMCREKEFVEIFNNYCRDNHFAPVKWTSQLYSCPFVDFKITVKKTCIGTCLLGIGLNKELSS